MTIDESNPCEAAAALRAIYRTIITGGRAQIVSFKAGENGTERSVTYAKPDVAALRREIQAFEEKCAIASGGKRKRFAARAGGRI